MISLRTTKILLTRWGRALHYLPPRADHIRERVLAATSSTAHTVTAGARRWAMPWPALAFVGLAVVAFLVQPQLPNARQSNEFVPVVPSALESSKTVLNSEPGYSEPEYGYGEGAANNKEGAAIGRSVRGLTVSGGSGIQSFTSPSQYPYPRYPQPTNGVPIADQRELIERSYHARAQTRHVEEFGDRLTTTIRGHRGRIDYASFSTTYGDVRFALPADEFDAFRREFQGMIHRRFLVESVTAQNRLPEQRGIEESRDQIMERITTLEEQQRTLAERHRKDAANLRAQLSETRRKLTAIRAEPIPEDAVARAARETRLRDLEREERRLLNRIAEEQRTFEAQDRNLTRQLEQQRSAYDGTIRQEQRLTERVATVQGTISVRQITIGEIVGRYLRDYWVGALLGLLGIVAIRRWWRGMDREPIIAR